MSVILVDDIMKHISMRKSRITIEMFITIEISTEFFPNGPIDKTPACFR